jgi:hypothetical protein
MVSWRKEKIEFLPNLAFKFGTRIGTLTEKY